MNNMGAMYRFELRKILRRKITVLALIAMSLLLVGVNIGEYVAGSKIVNKDETVLLGRKVDNALLDEMRAAVEPETVTTEDGTAKIIDVQIKDEAFKPLMGYLKIIGGNADRAYSMTEAKLEETFDGVVDDRLKELRLTEKETDYWRTRRGSDSMPLTYGKIQNGWGDSVGIIYVVAIFSMICIAATLSGVFSDETQLRTDALIFSSRNGKSRLAAAKFLAGITVGVLETLILLLVCVGTEFAVSGFGGGETSIQFFFGPSAMDMPVREVFWIYAGIMLIIGVMLSAFAMCLSQTLKNSIAVIAVMMVLWLLSMLNVPESMRLISQAWSYMPVTFLGSWVFSEYRMVNLFGRLFTVLEFAPILYLLVTAALGAVTKISYGKYQVSK